MIYDWAGAMSSSITLLRRWARDYIREMNWDELKALLQLLLLLQLLHRLHLLPLAFEAQKPGFQRNQIR